MQEEKSVNMPLPSARNEPRDADEFCRQQNILYDRSSCGNELAKSISFALYKKKSLNAKFRSVNWMKGIEEVVVEVNGVRLTYRYGGKRHNDWFKPEPEDFLASEASLQFFKILAGFVKQFTNGKKHLRKRHNGVVCCIDCDELFPRYHYWELVNYRILEII